LLADDTSLYLVVENEYDKTEIMTISKKHHKPHHPPVYMDNVIIKEIETHKHLGLTIREVSSASNLILQKILLTISLM
jgi:hypothetical protein